MSRASAEIRGKVIELCAAFPGLPVSWPRRQARFMHCPFCSHPETKVIDSRLAGEGAQIRRRRECLACGERFTTFETAELVMPRVIKRDDTPRALRRRQAAQRHGPRAGEAPGRAARQWRRRWPGSTHRLQTMGEREVPRAASANW